MELIKLPPRLDVDPSLRLRSPGEVLFHDYMRPDGINPAQLARRTGIRTRYIKEILAGARSVTPRYAIRLAVVLQTSALYWLVLQARYDLAREERGIPAPGRAAASTEALLYLR
jgi:addiction module HigA family antidote